MDDENTTTVEVPPAPFVLAPVWHLEGFNPKDKSAITMQNLPAVDMVAAVQDYVVRFPGYMLTSVRGYYKDQHGSTQNLQYFYTQDGVEDFY